MKPKFILTFSSVYLALVGLGLLFAPTDTVLGLENGGSPLLISQLRAMSDVFFGVAVLNWAARNAEASKARNAIFLGNIVGFSLSVLLGINVSIVGGQMVSFIYTALSLFCAIGFIVTSRTNWSSKT
jgi:hypothetical protein